MIKSKTARDNEQLEPQRRRNNVWTRDKITRLIRLYRQHECLWNNYIETYKNKEKRILAIQDICTTLRITKFDFGKKIHNLRNQFNAETKKLDKRLEESGCSAEDPALDTTQFRSRWEHYESLLFLKDVIAPRPGYQPRKIELKYQQHSSDDDDAVVFAHVDELDADHTATDVAPANECIAEDETVFQYQEATPEEEPEMDEQDVLDEFMTTQHERANHTDDVDQKYSPPTTMREVIITTLPTKTTNTGKTTYFAAVQNNQSAQNQLSKMSRKSVQRKQLLHQRVTAATAQNSKPSNQVGIGGAAESVVRSKHLSDAIVELGAASAEPSTTSTQMRPIKRRLSDSFQSSATPIRDQWDAFGEMVAAEFRNLNSDISRKKLKRKIMQAMLEVGEADDGININIAIN